MNNLTRPRFLSIMLTVVVLHVILAGVLGVFWALAGAGIIYGSPLALGGLIVIVIVIFLLVGPFAAFISGMWKILLVVLGIGVCLVFVTVIVNKPEEITVPLHAGDELLADMAVTLVQTELTQLPTDDKILNRYGSFKSISAVRLERRREYRFFDQHYPACLKITCQCVFSKFQTPMKVTVVNRAGPKVTFDLDPPRGPSPGYTMVQTDSGLWFYGDRIRVHCFIDCCVMHPDFKP